MDTYEQVGDVRGHGLMMGIEIVKDKESKEPDLELVAEIWERTKDYGLLIGKGGAYGNTFRVQPPMCISHDDIDFTLDVIDRSIKESLQKLNR